MCSARHCVSCNWHPRPTFLPPRHLPQPMGTHFCTAQLIHQHSHPLHQHQPLFSNNWLSFWQLSHVMPPSQSSSFQRGACHVCRLAHKSQPWPALPIQKQQGGFIALEALKAHRLLPCSNASNVISLPLYACSACFFFLVTYLAHQSITRYAQWLLIPPPPSPSLLRAHIENHILCLLETVSR